MTGVRVRTVPNAGALLLGDPRAGALVAAGAALVAEKAAEVVPHRTGHAAASYHSTTATRTPLGVVATAYTDDVAGHLFEFGSANNPVYAPLRRGVGRAGFRAHPFPKGT